MSVPNSSIMSVVTQIDPMLEEASRAFAAIAGDVPTRHKPLARPGIAAGSTSFHLDGFIVQIPELIAALVQMYAVLVFQQMMTVLNWPFGAALSLILLAVALGFARSSKLRRAPTRN